MEGLYGMCATRLGTKLSVDHKAKLSVSRRKSIQDHILEGAWQMYLDGDSIQAIVLKIGISYSVLQRRFAALPGYQNLARERQEANRRVLAVILVLLTR